MPRVAIQHAIHLLSRLPVQHRAVDRSHPSITTYPSLKLRRLRRRALRSGTLFSSVRTASGHRLRSSCEELLPSIDVRKTIQNRLTSHGDSQILGGPDPTFRSGASGGFQGTSTSSSTPHVACRDTTIARHELRLLSESQLRLPVQTLRVAQFPVRTTPTSRTSRPQSQSSSFGPEFPNPEAPTIHCALRLRS